MRKRYTTMRVDNILKKKLDAIRRERLIHGVDAEPASYRRMTKAMVNAIDEIPSISSRLIFAPLIPEKKVKRPKRGINGYK